ncbi:menaquinone biosynthesis protein [Stieleria sp. TO1_6]|uniref:menaquinone biosynthetic enzyme MqnA/MqnD family protein n=1 Tax=Stieleria tagensis TaxID=2956795 RepID=UPI00209B00C9|nr:menaquinone biosynthesis protein [Stieleria tagensis]MCO8121221.1 menaquinone biosynthesis protein [Stieleria tagensis]
MTRIGAVSYLNTKPLIHGLKSSLGTGDSLTLNLPSRLAAGLQSGELDLALIPSVEYFRGAGYRIISDAVIACRGPVWSVRLLSRVPVDQIRRLALDEGSRTSAAMVRVLLWQMYRLKPETTVLSMEQTPESVDADAVLVIGDRAMHPERGVYQEIWDLGDRWCLHTETPFVFAMWVARPGIDVDYLAPILQSCRDRGCESLETIARQYAAGHGLTNEDLYRYFAENLHFHLGDREVRGLDRFRDGCQELGLIPDRVS